MFVYSPFFTLPRMNRAICGDNEMFICSMAIARCSCRNYRSSVYG
jgi:hypothetical protein